MDFATGFAAGLAFGKKKFGGGSDEEWKTPSDWPDVPEPADYEMYFLIESKNAEGRISIILSNSETVNTGSGNVNIDWGDGTSDYYFDGDWSLLQHTYSDTGKYVVKICASKDANFFQNVSYYGSDLLMIKLGDEIVVNNGSDSTTQAGFTGKGELRYIKFSGKGGLPRNGFNNNYSLCKVDIKIPPTKIPNNCFNGCYNLRSFDFSEVTEIKEYTGIYNSGFKKIEMPKLQKVSASAIKLNNILEEIYLPACTTIEKNGLQENRSLKKINAPNCTSVGDYAMSGCSCLRTVLTADNCTFGKDCFEGCYILDQEVLK